MEKHILIPKSWLIIQTIGTIFNIKERNSWWSTYLGAKVQTQDNSTDKTISDCKIVISTFMCWKSFKTFAVKHHPSFWLYKTTL